MADGSVRGADARCVAMLEAMKQVVNDYATPPDKALERDLHKKAARAAAPLSPPFPSQQYHALFALFFCARANRQRCFLPFHLASRRRAQ
jgi:hypothetical protein